MWALHEGDGPFSMTSLNIAQQSTITELQSSHIKTTRSIYPILTKLLLIEQAKQLSSLVDR